MDMKTYLETTTQAEFAERLGVSQGLVSQWLLGRTRITAERCRDIERVTNGAVTRRELRPDLYGTEPEAAA